jgi:hypothetical protein
MTAIVDVATTIENFTDPAGVIPNTANIGALTDDHNIVADGLLKIKTSIQTLESIIGLPIHDLSSSSPTLVDAINSIAQTVNPTTLLGDLNTLTTSVKSTIVGAINELEQLKLNTSVLGAFGLTMAGTVSVTAARTALGLGTAALSSTSAFAAASHTHTFGSLAGLPSTISGFGITDSYTKAQTDAAILSAVSGGTDAFATLNTAIAAKLSSSAVSSYGLTLTGATTSAAARTVLQLGTASLLDASVLKLVSNTQAALTGGGTLTVATQTGSYPLIVGWSLKFTAVGVNRGAALTTTGRFDVSQPAAGQSIAGHSGAANRTALSNGIALQATETLWYDLPLGTNGASAPGNFHITQISADFDIPATWILIATANEDATVNFIGKRVVVRSGGTLNTAIADVSVASTAATATSATNAISVGGVTPGATGAAVLAATTAFAGRTALGFDTATETAFGITRLATQAEMDAESAIVAASPAKILAAGDPWFSAFKARLNIPAPINYGSYSNTRTITYPLGWILLADEDSFTGGASNMNQSAYVGVNSVNPVRYICGDNTGIFGHSSALPGLWMILGRHVTLDSSPNFCLLVRIT